MADLVGAWRAIEKAERVAITSHDKVDGDALGSALGLRRLLGTMCRDAAVVGVFPVPERYSFLVSDEDVGVAEGVSPGDFDVLVTLDSAADSLLPESIRPWLHQLPVVNIDHHADNQRYGRVNYVDPEASSTGEIIWNVAQVAGAECSRPAAEALWVALVTDTGRFSYSNTGPRTLKAAAGMLEVGVDTASVNRALYEAVPLRQLKLQERVLSRVEVVAGGLVSLASLTEGDLVETGCQLGDIQDLVDIPRRVAGSQVAILFYELPGRGETKVSIRSQAPHDAAALCREFGGGGHARAAGCVLTGDVAQARLQVVPVVEAHVRG